MSVSHPNCVTTYKLSVIRLLRGDGLLEPDDSATSVPMSPGSHGSPSGSADAGSAPAASSAALARRSPSPAPLRLSTDSEEGGASGTLTSAQTLSSAATGATARTRRVQSLLSGAEGVEVPDPYGPLPPGLYESWMVIEVRRVQRVCLGSGFGFGLA